MRESIGQAGTTDSLFIQLNIKQLLSAIKSGEIYSCDSTGQFKTYIHGKAFIYFPFIIFVQPEHWFRGYIFIVE
jgi:hypothetical protein